MNSGCIGLDAWMAGGRAPRCIDDTPVYIVSGPRDYESLIEECGVLAIIDASEKGLLAYCAEKNTEIYIDANGDRTLLVHIEPAALLEKIRRRLSLMV